MAKRLEMDSEGAMSLAHIMDPFFARPSNPNARNLVTPTLSNYTDYKRGTRREKNTVSLPSYDNIKNDSTNQSSRTPKAVSFSDDGFNKQARQARSPSAFDNKNSTNQQPGKRILPSAFENENSVNRKLLKDRSPSAFDEDISTNQQLNKGRSPSALNRDNTANQPGKDRQQSAFDDDNSTSRQPRIGRLPPAFDNDKSPNQHQRKGQSSAFDDKSSNLQLGKSPSPSAFDKENTTDPRAEKKRSSSAFGDNSANEQAKKPITLSADHNINMASRKSKIPVLLTPCPSNNWADRKSKTPVSLSDVEYTDDIWMDLQDKKPMPPRSPLSPTVYEKINNVWRSVQTKRQLSPVVCDDTNNNWVDSIYDDPLPEYSDDSDSVQGDPRKKSNTIECPNCKTMVKTEVKNVPSDMGHALCVCCILLGCFFGCCLIPYCFGRKFIHVCPDCKEEITIPKDYAITTQPKPTIPFQDDHLPVYC